MLDGYILTPDPDSDSRFYLTYVTKSDMGGSVPKFIKNIIMNDSAGYVIKLKKLLEGGEFN